MNKTFIKLVLTLFLLLGMNGVISAQSCEVSLANQTEYLDIDLSANDTVNIKLAKEENVQFIGAGDTSHWMVDQDAPGYIMFKPLKNATQNNIVIMTNKSAYHVDVQISNHTNVSNRQPNLVEVLYKQKSYTNVSCKKEYVTDIALQNEEKIRSIKNVDKRSWVIEKATSGKGVNYQEHLLIKPLDVASNNILVITTDKRTYYINAEVSDKFNEVVRWTYN